MPKNKKKKVNTIPTDKLSQEQFGRRLEEWILRRGETRSSFCKALNYDEGALSRIIHGTRNLSIGKAGTMLKHLRLSMTELYAGKDFTEMEKRFPGEFDLLRQFLLIVDDVGLRDFKRDMQRLVQEATERRKDKPPAKPFERVV